MAHRGDTNKNTYHDTKAPKPNIIKNNLKMSEKGKDRGHRYQEFEVKVDGDRIGEGRSPIGEDELNLSLTILSRAPSLINLLISWSDSLLPEKLNLKLARSHSSYLFSRPSRPSLVGSPRWCTSYLPLQSTLTVTSLTTGAGAITTAGSPLWQRPSSHGIAIGSKTLGGVENVFAGHINIFSTGIGVHVKTYDGKGDTIISIIMSNVYMEKVRTEMRILRDTGDHPDNGRKCECSTDDLDISENLVTPYVAPIFIMGEFNVLRDSTVLNNGMMLHIYLKDKNVDIVHKTAKRYLIASIIQSRDEGKSVKSKTSEKMEMPLKNPNKKPKFTRAKNEFDKDREKKSHMDEEEKPDLNGEKEPNLDEEN
ncbi:hypothetical protein Syun_029534 [Stephania yunnanensis]|uniref:Uncharacterized protein n=1 Tax=Stephania yunnanensis TaxID=152371 RepID=A0AAP0E858_9MAGN